MKADISGLRETTRNITHYRRNNGFTAEITALDPKDGHAIITVRFYQPGSVTYSCIWINGTHYGGGYGRGYGKASGCGYHKASAALSEALSDAGVKVSKDIDSIGDDAMLDAVEVIALVVSGLSRVIIHKARP